MRVGMASLIGPGRTSWNSFEAELAVFDDELGHPETLGSKDGKRQDHSQ